MTAPFSWDSPTFGQPGHNVHVSTAAPDAHTDEPEQESSR